MVPLSPSVGLQLRVFLFLFSSQRLSEYIRWGAWWATVHGVAKSRTRLSDFTSTFKFRWGGKWSNRCLGGQAWKWKRNVYGKASEMNTAGSFPGRSCLLPGLVSSRHPRSLGSERGIAASLRQESRCSLAAPPGLTGKRAEAGALPGHSPRARRARDRPIPGPIPEAASGPPQTGGQSRAQGSQLAGRPGRRAPRCWRRAPLSSPP